MLAARKLVLVGIPCFFEPGTTPQLIFGMLCSVISLLLYSQYAPFEEIWDNRLSQVCQLQIFVNLLAELYITYSPNSTAVSVVLFAFLAFTGLVALGSEDFVRTCLGKTLKRCKAAVLKRAVSWRTPMWIGNTTVSSKSHPCGATASHV